VSRARSRWTFDISHSPDEVFAVAAERRLLEEARNEAMVLDVVDVLLLQRSFASAIAERQLVVLSVILREVVVVGHGCALSDFSRLHLHFTRRDLAD
jgi:hypothetical protein